MPIRGVSPALRYARPLRFESQAQLSKHPESAFGGIRTAVAQVARFTSVVVNCPIGGRDIDLHFEANRILYEARARANGSKKSTRSPGGDSPDTPFLFETKYERIGKARRPFTTHGMARWDDGPRRTGRRVQRWGSIDCASAEHRGFSACDPDWRRARTAWSRCGAARRYAHDGAH